MALALALALALVRDGHALCSDVRTIQLSTPAILYQMPRFCQQLYCIFFNFFEGGQSTGNALWEAHRCGFPEIRSAIRDGVV
jgi:hypothetical protein